MKLFWWKKENNAPRVGAPGTAVDGRIINPVDRSGQATSEIASEAVNVTEVVVVPATTSIDSSESNDRDALEEPERVLPLRLCEVLEKEYVTLHGPLPKEYPHWTLRERDISFDDLLNYFLFPTKSPFGDAVKHIRKSLPVESAELEMERPIPAELRMRLIEGLNHQLRNADLLYPLEFIDVDCKRPLIPILS